MPPLVTPTPGLVVPSWKLVASCTRVARGHRLRARLLLEPLALEHLVLEPLRVVTRLEPAPTHWRRRRTAAAAIVGAGAWSTGPAVIAAAVEMVALAAPALPPIPGVRSPATVVIVTAAVVAPTAVHANLCNVTPSCNVLRATGQACSRRPERRGVKNRHNKGDLSGAVRGFTHTCTRSIYAVSFPRRARNSRYRLHLVAFCCGF